MNTNDLNELTKAYETFNAMVSNLHGEIIKDAQAFAKAYKQAHEAVIGVGEGPYREWFDRYDSIEFDYYDYLEIKFIEYGRYGGSDETVFSISLETAANDENKMKYISDYSARLKANIEADRQREERAKMEKIAALEQELAKLKSEQ